MNVIVLDRPQPHRAMRKSFKPELIARDRFARDWPSIADDRDLRLYIYQSREFLDVWMNTIGRAGGIECYFLMVKDRDAEPVLYLPLAIETKFNIRFLRFMDGGVADYNAPIVRTGRNFTQQEFDAIWADVLTLLPHVDVIDLKKIASDISGAPNPLTYLRCSPHSESGHVLQLAGPAQTDGNSTPSVSLKQKLGRELRKLGETHGVEFVVNPDSSTADEFTKKLFDLKRRKYQQTNVADFLGTPGIADFYRQIASPQQLEKIGHLSALLVDGTPISVHLGFAGRGRFYYILPAYDATYARHRPGHLLLNYLVDQTQKQGFETLDLGLGDEAYKISWATQRIALYDYQHAMTAAGQLYLRMRSVRRFIKSGGVRNWFRPADRTGPSYRDWKYIRN